MKEFMMLFRSENHEEDMQPSPVQLQAMLAKWDSWLGGLGAQDKLVGTNALGMQGHIVKADGTVTDGPYVSLKEVVGGYTIVRAEDINEAVKLAEGCPMFDMGGTVEVRDIMIFDKD